MLRPRPKRITRVLPTRALRVLIELAIPYQIDPDYIADGRPDFTEKHREKVVKYINSLAESFGMSVQTGGIACNYFDRFVTHELRKGPIRKQQMHIIASTCLLIASKFFESSLLPHSQLVIAHNYAVTSEQFARQELEILKVLDWNLHVILPHALVEPLRACLPGLPFDRAIDDKMMFFVDLSVYGYKLLRYSAAEVLGGALLAAWKFSGEHAAVEHYLPALTDACATTEERIKGCNTDLVGCYQACFPDAARTCAQTSGLVFDPVSPEPENGDQQHGSMTVEKVEAGVADTRPTQRRRLQQEESPLIDFCPLCPLGTTAKTQTTPAPDDERCSPTEIFAHEL